VIILFIPATKNWDECIIHQAINFVNNYNVKSTKQLRCCVTLVIIFHVWIIGSMAAGGPDAWSSINLIGYIPAWLPTPAISKKHFNDKKIEKPTFGLRIIQVSPGLQNLSY